MQNTGRPTFFLVLLVGLVAVLSVVQAWIYAPNHDQITMLASARAYNLFSQYGHDLWEINPPVYFLWLKPALWAHDVFGGAAYLWSLALQAVLLCASAMALRSIWARYYVNAAQADLFSILYVFAVFLFGNFNYPQRETVLALGLIPALFLLCAVPQMWQQGKTLLLQDKAVFIAAVGLLMIKPHYAVVLGAGAVGVLFYAIKQKQVYALLKQFKLVVFASLLLVGGAGWLVLHSGWLDFYLSYKPIYDANGYTAGTNKAIAVMLLLSCLGLITLLYVKARQSGVVSVRRDMALLGLTVILVGAGYVQGKGFYNHYVPAMLLLLCFAGVLILQAGAIQKKAVWQGVILPGLALLPMAGVWGLYLAAFALSTTRPLHTALPLYQQLQQIAPQRVMVLSTFIGTPVRLTGILGAELVQSYPHLWTYPFYARQIVAGDMQRENAAWVQERDFVLKRFVQDAEKGHPDILLVPDGVELTADDIALDVPKLLAESPVYPVLIGHFSHQTKVKGWTIFYGWRD